MRIAKAISDTGYTSRRKAESLIQLGTVKVNGKIIEDPAVDVNPEVDVITIEGKRLQKPKSRIYILLNKPTKCVTTTDDELGRETIMDLIKPRHRKGNLYPIGRLDYNSEGVLLLTNDGDITNKILHPSYEIPKTYEVKIQGLIDVKILNRLRRGIKLPEGTLFFKNIKIIKSTPNNTWLELTITEGRNRIIRRAFEHIRYQVLKLRRVSIGFINAGELRPGEYRFLESDEIKKLKNMFSDQPKKSKSKNSLPRTIKKSS
jgi:23S rRNA pseudouridine2605 synthase